MITNKTFEEMLEDIEFEEWISYKILIPENDFEIFIKCNFANDGSKILVPKWDFIETIVDLVDSCKLVIDSSTFLYEYFTNAIDHGNKKQYYLPISLKVFKGKNGNVLRLRDSGSGFDFENLLYMKDNGKKYYKRGGKGLKVYAYHRWFISFEDDGSVLNAMIINENN